MSVNPPTENPSNPPTENPSNPPTENPNNPPAVIEGPSFFDEIPEDYRDKDYAKAIASAQDPKAEMWKYIDGLAASVAQRPAGMPDGTDPEAIKNWTTHVAPKDISVYGTLAPTLTDEQADLKELLEGGYAPEMMNGLLETARQAGIQPWQMQPLVEAFNQNQIKMAEQYMTDTSTHLTAWDQEFDTLTTQWFGKEKDEILNTGKEFLLQHVPPEIKKHVEVLPNDALAVVASLAYQMKNKYGREDTIPNASGGGNTLAIQDEPFLKASIQELMGNPAYSNEFHPQHKATFEKTKGLIKQLAAMQSARRV